MSNNAMPRITPIPSRILAADRCFAVIR